MASAAIKELSDSTFDSVIKENASKPVVIDFWAPWCGPCKALGPILEEIATEMGHGVQICKVNVDENTEVAGRFQVRAIPTIAIFKDGKLVDQIVGLATKNDLKNRINSFV